MAGDVTVGALARLSHMPRSPNRDGGNLIAGQNYYDIYFTGGIIQNVALQNCTITLDSIDSTPIGANVASTGKFTTLSTSGLLTANSLNVTGAFNPATISVANNATVGGTLGVTGAATFGSSITAAGTLTVSSLNAAGVVHTSGAGLFSTSSVVTADLANASVTYAKVQNVTNNTILGNVSGAPAAPSEVTAAQLKTLLGGLGTLAPLNLPGGNALTLLIAGLGTLSDGTSLFGLFNGQCYLQSPPLATPAATMKLAPFNGNLILIGGKPYAIPAAGVSVNAASISLAAAGTGIITASQALAANGTYLLALQYISSVLTPVAYPAASFTYGPDTTAGNIGNTVIFNGATPITGATLFGIVNLNASSQFYYMGTASWFNPVLKTAYSTFSTPRSTSSNSIVEVNSETRIPFVTFTERQVQTNIYGCGYTSGGSTCTPSTAILIDGSANANIYAYSGTTIAAGFFFPAAAAYTGPLTSGTHYASIGAWTSNSSALTYPVWTQSAGTGYGSSATYPGVQLGVSIYG